MLMEFRVGKGGIGPLMARNVSALMAGRHRFEHVAWGEDPMEAVRRCVILSA
jgi:hypothetical protein